MDAQMNRRNAIAIVPIIALCSVILGHSLMTRADDSVSGAKKNASIDRIAESFVRLALALGEHDPLYVDAYSGPAVWREEAKKQRKPLKEILQAANPLVAELKAMDGSGEENRMQLRRLLLIRQLESLAARAGMLDGATFEFDEESRKLYDVVAPHRDEKKFREVLGKIDSLVPQGKGTLLDRLENYKKDFIIPGDRLNAVFTAAINEARKRTKEHIALPVNETFTVEYVKGRPWGAYNWYKGANRSLIEINTDLPTYIDAPLALACHEGYPGHHVQNVLYDQGLLKGEGWIEFAVFPLFSPISVINEGVADFGVEAAFPGDARLTFERGVLYPIAGLDPGKAAKYDGIRRLLKELQWAEVEAARLYLDGKISSEGAAQYLSSNALLSPDRARRLVSFFDQYRSYILTYSLGYDLVKGYIEKRGGTFDRPEKRWEELRLLISAPRIPSALNY